MEAKVDADRKEICRMGGDGGIICFSMKVSVRDTEQNYTHSSSTIFS